MVLKYICPILLCLISTTPGSESTTQRSILVPSANTIESCFEEIGKTCDPLANDYDTAEPTCTAKFGGFKSPRPKLITDAQNLIRLYLQTSMQYMLISSHFNEWDINRKGFHNYFSKLSDDSWDIAQALIHHMTERGGNLDPDFKVSMPEKQEYRLGELVALSKGLEIEKKTCHRDITSYTRSITCRGWKNTRWRICSFLVRENI